MNIPIDNYQHLSSSNTRLESIHIMRGLAAFLVMMGHLTYANEKFRANLPDFCSMFSFATSGIWMFFVISGFVIPLAMKHVGYQFRSSAWPFFLRRIVRLEPPYIVSVLFATLLACAATHSPGYRGVPFSVDTQAFFLQFFYLAPWFGKDWINGVTWSLAIEFKYYFLMLFIGRSYCPYQ